MTLLSGVVSLFSNNFTDNIRVVPDNVTVQQVIDSITDASLTNKYLIVIPSGHETETFSYKPGLEFYFLDGTGRKPIYEELEGWNDSSNWATNNCSLTTADDDYGDGRNYLVITPSSSTSDAHITMSGVDLRKYQGVKLKFITTVDNINDLTAKIRIYHGGWSSFVAFPSITISPTSGKTSEEVIAQYYFGFDFDSYVGAYWDEDLRDWSDVRFRITFRNTASVQIKLHSVELVRTLPFPAVFVRCDDSGIVGNHRIEAFYALRELGVRSTWAIVADDIFGTTSNSSSIVSRDVIYDIYKSGICDIANHSLTHPHFDTLTENETSFNVAASVKVFRSLGLHDASKFFVNPYSSKNPYLLQLLERLGILGLYTHHASITGAVVEADFTGFQNARGHGCGGIDTLLWHGSDVSDDTALNTFISNMQSLVQHFKPVTLEEIQCMMPGQESGQSEDSVMQDSLSDNLDTKFYTDTYILDPNGVDRNLTPFQYGYKAGDRHLIINSGSANNLVFDPSGLNLSITPGNSATVLYDGSNWRQI